MIFIGSLSFNHEIMEADIQGIPAFKTSQSTLREALEIKNNLEASM